MSEDLLRDLKIEWGAEETTEDMLKQDNIECPVCLSYGIGVKLPKCQHYICTKCYYVIYEYGYLGDEFLEHHNLPIEPTRPKYPYVNKPELLEDIYSNFQLNGKFKELFIEDNKDLYECFKMGHYKDKVIEEWINTNELIKQYELDKQKYKKNMKTYTKQTENYIELKKQDLKSNTSPVCPLCRR
jgi:hypothetical protein